MVFKGSSDVRNTNKLTKISKDVDFPSKNPTYPISKSTGKVEIFVRMDLYTLNSTS